MENWWRWYWLGHLNARRLFFLPLAVNQVGMGALLRTSGSPEEGLLLSYSGHGGIDTVSGCTIDGGDFG